MGGRKAYLWNVLLMEAKGQLGLKWYSYVSLFGLNSLNDLKYSIFENTIEKGDIGIEASVQTFLKTQTRRRAKSTESTKPFIRMVGRRCSPFVFVSFRRQSNYLHR